MGQNGEFSARGSSLSSLIYITSEGAPQGLVNGRAKPAASM